MQFLDRAARIEAIIFILNVHNTEIIKIYYQQEMQKTLVGIWFYLVHNKNYTTFELRNY